MKDHIMAGRDRETGLWHGLFYRNHPTPSGEPRPMLRLSTTQGYETELEALRVMKSAFTAEQLKDVDCPDTSEPLDESLFTL